MLDMLVINANIIDGTGSPAYEGNVGIKDGKLIIFKKDDPFCKGKDAAKQVIDAAGRVVCPGFIDAHSHGDEKFGTQDGRLFKTPQGITTELTGQCGISPAISNPDIGNYPKFVDFVERCELSANAKCYVGHNDLRKAVMGIENRLATANELDQMKSLLREAMEAGAAGLSTGLIYLPGCYSDTNEIVELAKVIEPFNGIYASHMRNESFAVVEAVKETLEIGRRAGVRVDISHHKIMGRNNWGRQKETLALIQKANEEGIHTTCDQYPFSRCMTELRACIPNWHWSMGNERLSEELKRPEFRERLKVEMNDPVMRYDNFYLNAGDWNGVYITDADATPEAVGFFVSEYAQKIGKDPWDTFFDLMIENNCTIEGVFCSMSDEDMCDIITSPYCVVGTDCCSSTWQSKGHPRASATFPRAIDLYVKEKKVLTLEQMIHKMTGLTADRLLVPNKGILKDGYDADVVIMDYENLYNPATYDNPNHLTRGIDYVIVNGQIVYHNLEFTGNYSGRYIKHPVG